MYISYLIGLCIFTIYGTSIFQTDTFIVEAVDLGRLDQVCVGHDGKGPGSGWFLQQVTVRESMEAEEEYVFKCDR